MDHASQERPSGERRKSRRHAPPRQLEQRHVLVKPLNDAVLGSGYMRVTTALPDDNQRFVTALAEILGRGEDRPI